MLAELITRDASIDDMLQVDYMDTFTKLRQAAGSLDKFCVAVKSGYSKATWSKLERGEIQLTRQMRSELRKAIGSQPLPLTIDEATAKTSPDACVWRIGTDVAKHLIMVATDNAVTLRVNGTVEVSPSTQNSLVTGSTPALLNTSYLNRMDMNQKEKHSARRENVVCVSRATTAQNERRKALNVAWGDVIESGLRMLENMP